AAAGGYAGALQPLPRWPLFWEQQQPSVPLPGSAARGSGGAVSGGPALGGAGGSVVKDPTFEFAAASALVAELVDFATTCRLDYVTSLVSESESDCPLSVGGELALEVTSLRTSSFSSVASRLLYLILLPC
ncbi:unnamed protein product, partial [Closterium sp. NIES-53]